MTQPRRFDRRAFLKLSGVALGASLPLVSPAIGLASLDQKLKVAQETRMLMGTVVAVTVVDPSADLAQEAMNQAFLRMATLAPLFDRHAGSGPVVHLNAQGQLNELPPELRDVLGLVAEVSERSGGAFDITVAPLVDAFTRSYQAGRATTPAEIRAALAAVGGLQLTPAGLVLTKENAAVTLDGVAKGFIADQGLAAAARAGARRVLINAGGDVAALGERQEGRAWQVAVSDPAAREAQGGDPLARRRHRHQRQLRGIFRPRTALPPHRRPPHRPFAPHRRLGQRARPDLRPGRYPLHHLLRAGAAGGHAPHGQLFRRRGPHPDPPGPAHHEPGLPGLGGGGRKEAEGRKRGVSTGVATGETEW